MKALMTQYVVYFNPTDYPMKYVLRRWFIVAKGDPLPNEQPDMVEDSYDPIEAYLSRLGLVALNRMPEDDPCIKEIWI